LFDLPEYGIAFADFLESELEARAGRQVPLLAHIQRERTDYVRTAHVATPQGNIEIEPVGASFALPVDLREVLDFNTDALGRCLDELALQHADAQIDNLLRHVNTIAEALGNTVDGRGQPLDWPVLLSVFEKIPLEFGSDGEPKLPLIVDDSNRRVITPYPPIGDRDRLAFDKLMLRKRREFDAGADSQ